MAERRYVAEPSILLFDKLVQESRAKLCERALDIAATKPASRRSLLQKRLFTLLGQRLKERALLLLCDSRALLLWPGKPKNIKLRLKCWRPSGNEWLEQLPRCIKLPALVRRSGRQGLR